MKVVSRVASISDKRLRRLKMQYSLLLICGKIQKIVLPLLAEKLDILDLGDVLSNHNFVSK